MKLPHPGETFSEEGQIMGMHCRRCGRKLADEGMKFCPWCGSQVSDPGKEEPAADPRMKEWIRKALAETGLPKRKRILEKAKEEFPDAPEIDWELLFIGHENPKPRRGQIDYSIIKSSLLNIYRAPGDFSPEERERMRKELFEDPQLTRLLAASGNPEGRMREYLQRLCSEYTEIFLAGDNRINGTIFGFSLKRDTGKAIAGTVSQMLRNMDADAALSSERREMLRDALIRAYLGTEGGKIEYLEG